MQPTLVILAAGAGTRYGGLKQLEPVGPSGETLLEYSAYDALRAGFGRIVLVVRPEAESMFSDQFESGLGRRAALAYVHQTLAGSSTSADRPVERAKPWGTGHAVLAVESEIDGPFAVINADDFYGAESYAQLFGFLDESRESESMAALGFPVGETLAAAGAVSRAVLDADGKGRLSSLIEYVEVWRQAGQIHCRDHNGRRKTLVGDELVSMNMWAFTPDLFPGMHVLFSEFLTRFADDPEAEFLLPEVIQTLIQSESIQVAVISGRSEWCGITYRQDRSLVSTVISSLVEQGHYPDRLWA